MLDPCSTGLISGNVVDHPAPLVRIPPFQYPPPILGSKELVVCPGMVRMSQEAIDFLVHESDKNFAFRILHNPLHCAKRGMREAEWINKNQAGSQECLLLL